MSNILFVDDDLAFLESIQRVFSSWSAGTAISIQGAHSVGDAIMILQENLIDVVVIDIRMPVVDGLQFLRLLNRKHPSVQKAILTGYAEEEYRTTCLAHGASLFLEKPRNADEMKSVYVALIQLLEFPQTQGFSGVIQQASLADMLQMLCTGGNSLILQVISNQGLAEIFIREGAVIHATVGEKEGYDAFYQVMKLRGGEFHTKPYAEPTKLTITHSWEYLLMESARLLDERGALEDTEKEEEQLNQPIAIAKPRPVTSPRIPSDSVSFKMGNLPDVPSYAAEKEGAVPLLRSPLRKETVPIEFSPIRLAQKPVPATTNLALDELVLCSSEGALIKNSGSENPDRRINFLELFSIKMRQINGRPEWGSLEYLAIQGSDYTAVVEFPGGMGSFGLVKKKNISPVEVRAAVANALKKIGLTADKPVFA